MLQIKLQMFITTKSLPDVQTGWRCLLQVRHSAPVQRDPPPPATLTFSCALTC